MSHRFLVTVHKSADRMRLIWYCILAPLWLLIHPGHTEYCIVLWCMLTGCTCIVCMHMLLIPLVPALGGCAATHHPTCLPHSPVCKTLSHLYMHMLPDPFVMQPQAKRGGASPCSAPCGSAHQDKCSPLASPLMGEGQVSCRLSGNVLPC